MKIVLKPCPFCGNRDSVKAGSLAEVEHKSTEWSKTHYGVVCDYLLSGCGASTGWYYESEEEAAKAWNTRV